MLLLITLFLPLVFAAVTYLAGDRLAKISAFTGSLLTLIGTVMLAQPLLSGSTNAITFATQWITNPNIQFALQVDGLGWVMLLLATLLTPLIILSSFNKVIDNARSFYALVLLMQFGMMGVFVSADAFLYYIFWELALIPIYFIALLWGENSDKAFRNRAVFKFFVYTLAGSLFMLIGFIYIYQLAGSFHISQLYGIPLTDVEQSFLFWAFFIAFAIKIPVFPFHTWQPETYKEAPAVGTMLLSGIMLKMGIYSLLRWLLPVLPHGVLLWTPLIIVLAVVGVLYGSLIAFRQDHLKRLLAYSSFAHVGLITAGIFTITAEGFQGAVVQMFAHGVNVVGLFMAAEIIFQRTGTHSIAQLGGIRSVAPWFATAFMIVVLASVALPTTNAFIGEFLLLYSVYKYNTWLAVVSGLTIVFGAVYMLRMYQYSMLGETNENTQVFEDLKWNEKAVFTAIIILIFALGIQPSFITDIVQPSLEKILNYSIR